MDKDRDRHKTEYDLDQLLKESFRMDDKSLLERFQRAQTEIDDSQIPRNRKMVLNGCWTKLKRKALSPNISATGKRRAGVERDAGSNQCLRLLW